MMVGTMAEGATSAHALQSTRGAFYVAVEMQWGSTGRAWMVGRVWGGRPEADAAVFRRRHFARSA
jgi:hypothetical protein